MLHTFHPLIYPMHIATHTYTHTRDHSFAGKYATLAEAKREGGLNKKK